MEYEQLAEPFDELLAYKKVPRNAEYRSLPQIHHLFCNFSLSTKRTGAYTRDVTFSHAIMPSFDQEMFSGFVDAGFVLELPFYQADLVAGELQR